MYYVVKPPKKLIKSDQKDMKESSSIFWAVTKKNDQKLDIPVGRVCAVFQVFIIFRLVRGSGSDKQMYIQANTGKPPTYADRKLKHCTNDGIRRTVEDFIYSFFSVPSFISRAIEQAWELNQWKGN